MVQLEQVIKARDNNSIAKDIFDVVFYDTKGNPKVRMWLVKKGVPIWELDDIEADLKLELVQCIHLYDHEKVPFEKFVWKSFSYILINWFKSKTAKKIQMVNVGLIDKNGDDVDYYVGDLTDDIVFDFESVIKVLPLRAQTVARVLFYSEGWTKRDIMKYYKMKEIEFDSCMLMINEVVLDYLKM